MKEKDITEKNFIALNDVFADIFNVLVFGGKQVITPDSLEQITGFSQYKADDTCLHEQVRYPVVTIVLYFGEKPWRYPLNLKQCFYPKLPENEITETLLPYITDYKVNLFDIPRLPQNVVKQFRSDFRIVADYFGNAYNNPEYEPDSAVITHVDEFLKLMKVLTGDNRYEAISFTEQEQKEGVKMCKVLDAREKRGIKQGATQVYELMRILAEQGYSIEEILTMTEEEDAREKLYKEYGIVTV